MAKSTKSANRKSPAKSPAAGSKTAAAKKAAKTSSNAAASKSSRGERKTASAKKTAAGAKKTAASAKKTAAGAKKTAAGAKKTAAGAKKTASAGAKKTAAGAKKTAAASVKTAGAKTATGRSAGRKRGGGNNNSSAEVQGSAPPVKSTHTAAFMKKQHTRLIELRDAMLDSMIGVARDNLRSRAEGNEASAFGMHQADAGSDSYDRDFALNLLSQEQDALYEIDEALKRIEDGTYGMCEISGEKIPQARLEAMPFARCTVACQTQLENEAKNAHSRRPVGSLFGLSEGEPSQSEEDNND